MSHWNYRIVKTKFAGDDVYSLREMYYDDEERENGWTEALNLEGYESPAELVAALELMHTAAERPIFDVEEWDAQRERDG